MTVRELFVKLGLDFDGGSVKKAEDRLGSLKKAAISLAQVFSVGALAYGLTHLVDQVTETADRVAKTAQQFGVGVEALQGLEYAADLAGVGADQLRASLSFLVRTAGDAAGGSKEAAKKFSSVGVSIKDANGNLKPTERRFREAADAIAGIQNPTKRTAAAIDLFGRDGARLIPLLKEGSKGIDKYAAELEGLGAVMTEDFTRASEEYRDNLTRAGRALFGLKVTIARAVLPVFDAGVRAFTKTVAIFNKLVSGSHFVEAAFAVLGAAAVVLGIKMLIPFLPYIAIAAVVIAATLAIIAVVDDLWVYFEGGESVTGRLVVKLREGVDALGAWWEAWTPASPVLGGLKLLIDAIVFAIRDLWSYATGGDSKIADFIKAGNDVYTGWRPVGGLFKSIADGVGLLLEGMDRLGQIPGVKELLKGSATAGLQMAASALPGASLFGAPDVGATLFNTTREVEAARAGGGSTTYAPSANVTVNAQTGADPNAIAIETQRQVDAALQAHLDDARAALVPALAR